MSIAEPTKTITLTDPAGACQFRRVPDDVVRAVVGEDAWEAAHAPGPRGTCTVTAIDRAACVITFDRIPSGGRYSGPLGHLRPVAP